MNDQIMEILLGTSALSPLLPAVLGIIYFRRVSFPLKIFIILSIVSVLSDGISYYYRSLSESTNTLKVIHTYLIIQTVMIYLIFSNVDFSSIKLKKIMKIIYILISVTAIFYFIFSYDPIKYSTNTVVLTGLATIISALIYFLDFSFYAQIKNERFPSTFFLISGLLIYNASIIAFFSTASILNQDSVTFLFNIKVIMAIVFNLLMMYTILIDIKSEA